MRRVSQLICLITLSVLLIFLLPIQAMAETTSDEVREYAETEGLETFLEIAPQLNLQEGIKTSDLVIGEALRSLPTEQVSTKNCPGPLDKGPGRDIISVQS